MKMTKEDYTVLKNHIFSQIDMNIKMNDKLNNRKEFVEEWDRIYKDYTETRKLWDMYWGIGGNVWKETAFNDIYDRRYNDNHITTALRKIYKELGK